MPALLLSPWGDQFDNLLAQASSFLLLCSPFIGLGPCERVACRAMGASWPATFELIILTDLSRDNILSGSTDLRGLDRLLESFPGTRIHFLPSLHAKVYVADEQSAVVTSGNMTDSGLLRNFEYGVLLTNATDVRRVKNDVLHYAALGSPIDHWQVREFLRITEDLREMRRAAEKTLRGRMRREFEKRLQQADDEILRARAAGRSIHGIFADTIRHILQSGPASTVEMHSKIRQIHPDICDDSVDRVIDGQRFGKKWKHAVRTAQQHLKKAGEIRLADGRWSLLRK